MISEARQKYGYNLLIGRMETDIRELVPDFNQKSDEEKSLILDLHFRGHYSSVRGAPAENEVFQSRETLVREELLKILEEKEIAKAQNSQ